MEMLKPGVVAKLSTPTLGLGPDAKARAWYSSIYLNMREEWVQEAPSPDGTSIRMSGCWMPTCCLTMDSTGAWWLTSAKVAFLPLKGTHRCLTEYQLWVPLLNTPLSFAPGALASMLSAHILSLCTCSFPCLLRPLLQIITWLFTPSRPSSVLQCLLSEAFYHHPLYNCVPIYSTPSTISSTGFLFEVLIPI